GVAGFIDDFRSGLLADLRQAIEDAGGNALTAIENAIKSAFWDTLGPGGIDILVDPESGGALDESLGFSQLDVVLDCDDGLAVDLRLASAISLIDTSENPIDFDIGVPGFGLEVDGNVKVSLGFDLKFGFGLSPEDGFFFNSSAPADDPELKVFFLAEVPGLAATGELFFLQLAVTDSEENPSFFEGRFEIDLMDPNGDGMLTFAEMSGPGVTFGDIVSANLSAEADVNLDLRASFGGNTAFPTIVAKFHLGWMWDLQDGAGEPVVEIRDLGLDLGSFISDFLEPVLAEIRKVTEPLDPVIEFVTARIPVLSDIAGETITMLDLAEAFGLLEPSTRDFIENVATVIQLINDIPTGNGSLIIPFGSISLQDDGSGNRAKVQQLQDIAAYTLDELEGAIEADPGAESYSMAAAGFASDAGSLDNFSIPVFDNPSELFNLFTGGSIRLVEWRMPEFKFEFVYTQSIPIYPPLYAKFGGRVAAIANIGFGYDTYGIQKFIASEDKNPLDIFDGFYIMDFDANGNEQFELELVGEIFAGVSINLTLVEVGVTVGFSLSIGFDLNDVNDDGRVRVSEIISLAQIDPRCLFNITLTGTIFLEAFLIVDLFFFSIDKTWRFAEITLFEIELSCPEPVLAQHGDDPELAALGLGAGDLVLNAGSRAIDRDEIDTTDGAETFIVKHVADEGGGKETVVVEWGSWNQEFNGVEKIWVMDGGAGDDHFSFSGVTSTVEASGGVGNDTIILSDGANSVANGDSGNDVITASVHENATGVTINGGAGKDILTGGSKGITINGGAGADEITGTDDEITGDVLNGDDGDDQIVAGKGDDQVDGGAGNDTIEGGVGDDVLFGGTGADTIRGSRGNDVIYAGEGSDSVKGGVDNDLLVGGSGDDHLDGHGGIDLIIGDDALSVNGFSIATAS
ncbi:MAG: calcium-binding protein, partial [Verrucomicrobiales bacterium]|nr:calcium-binding protein [Verrucomicrobiales bacterium]